MPEGPWTIGRYRGGLALVFYRDGKRRRHSLGRISPREAEQLAPALYTELTKPKGTTVAELWRAYTADKAGHSVVTRMIWSWKALEERFGDLSAEAITIEHCRAQVRARRAAGIKDGTIHTELGHLRMVLLWAEKHGLAKAPYIERPPKPATPEKHLTRAQLAALLDACDIPHVKLFVHLAYATAGRSAAVLGLTWARCDFEAGKIDLSDPAMTGPHKGRAIVPMTNSLRAALCGAKEGALTPYVIEWAGQRVMSIKKGLASAARRAGLKHVTPHMLRHTSAVHQAEAGVPMEEIASWLGHKQVAVTRAIYARFSPDALSKGRAALELGSAAPVRRTANGT